VRESDSAAGYGRGGELGALGAAQV